jgi:hypothetical protein
MTWIMYSTIHGTVRWLEPCALEFTIEDDRGLFEVMIIGGDGPDAVRLMKLLRMRLVQWKRDLLHANGSVVKAIQITRREEGEE